MKASGGLFWLAAGLVAFYLISRQDSEGFPSLPYRAGEAPSPEQRLAAGRLVQMALRDMGYYHGEIDGVVGPQTEAATGAFLRDRPSLALSLRSRYPTMSGAGFEYEVATAILQRAPADR